MREIVKCKQCGRKKSFYRVEHREFCSADCKKKFQRGSNATRWNPVRTRPCPQCSQPIAKYVFSETLGREVVSERVYCSRDCRILHRRLHPRESDREIGATSRYRDGYVYIKVADRGWMPEHRWVAERKIGRKLRREEEPHHINGIKTDNRPENLQVMLKVRAF